MSETLWGEPQDPQAHAGFVATRAIHAARVSYIEDLDKIAAVLKAGGTFHEMRAAVDAYRILSDIARELETAAKRVVATQENDH